MPARGDRGGRMRSSISGRQVTMPSTRFRSEMTELRTDRLLLRQWKDGDREPFAALNADPAVMEHFPALMTREQSDALVDRLEASLMQRGYGLWALEVLATGRFIGFTGLVD